MKHLLLIVCLLSAGSSAMRAASVSTPPAYCQAAYGATQENPSDRILSMKIAESKSLLSGASARLAEEFYEPCDSAPAWTSNGVLTPAAMAVLRVLRDVTKRGLNSEDYPGSFIPPPGPMSTTTTSVLGFARFEIELTIGAMRLARDIRCGRIDLHAIQADLFADCAGFQPAEFVWAVSRSEDPSRQFDLLEPSAPGYQRTEIALRHYLDLAQQPQITLPPFTKAVHPGEMSNTVATLRLLLTKTKDLTSTEEAHDLLYEGSIVSAVQSFQRRHGLAPDGILTAETYRQLVTPIDDRIAQLSLTLERWRWIQRSFPQPPIVVNVPEFKVRAYDDELRVALSMKVIVGGAYHRQTPIFQNQISSVVFRPYWNIPPSIQRKEVEPMMRRDPTYLKRHGYEIVRGPAGSVRIRQRPGDSNALGLIKFSLPNVHDVYLHGTPTQELFNRTRRDFSHGCIRVEDPAALAVWVLRQNPGWTREKIEAAMHGTQTFSVQLTQPIPILIVYGTGFAAEDGLVYFLPDIYDEDKLLLSALKTVTKQRQEGSMNPVVIRE